MCEITIAGMVIEAADGATAEMDCAMTSVNESRLLRNPAKGETGGAERMTALIEPPDLSLATVVRLAVSSSRSMAQRYRRGAVFQRPISGLARRVVGDTRRATH